MHQYFTQEEGKRMARIVFVLVAIVALYFGMKFINEVKTYGTIGIAPSDVNTIDVTGEGTAYAVPNVATESFTVQDQEATVALAQSSVNTKVAAALAFLKKQGVADADVTTTGYSAYPDYSSPCQGTACPIAPAAVGTTSNPQVVGYTVSQSVSVKIRNVANAGAIVTGLGTAGATGLDGPTYTVDDPTAIEDQARTKAIDAAEAKAQTLAKELGVRIVRITHYSESTNGNPSPSPMMYAAASGAVSSEAQLPSGQNEYTSDVTVTYEIR